MKKILIITTISGFLPQFEQNDVNILKENGYEVHYASNFKNPIYYCDKEALRKQGIVLHQIDIAKSPLNIRRNLKAFWQIRSVMKKEKIDAVHCHNPMGGVVGRLATIGLKHRPYVIYTAHGFHFYKGAPLQNWILYYTAERFLARFTDQIITINTEDCKRAKKFHLHKGGSVDMIHGVGVNAERYVYKQELREQMRQELNIPGDAFHIVTAAELNDNKNQTVVIEAIAEIGRKDIYYSICGKGPKEQELRDLIKERGLEGQIRLLGYRTDMENVLSSADCFAFPSIREGLGIAAVEALMCQVPLITADNRGTREYLVEDVNGIMCHRNSVDSYRKAIMRLLEHKNTRKRYRMACRESAMKFAITEVDKDMRKIYDRVPI